MRRLFHLLVPVCTVGWTLTKDQQDLLDKTTDIDPRKISRLFVIPDIHGDYESLVASLFLAVRSANEIANPPVEIPSLFHLNSLFEQAMNDNDFIASNPDKFPIFRETGFYLVQMGDLIDRGEFSQRCLKIMELVGRVIGFQVIQLIGNHELHAVVDPQFYQGHGGIIHPNDDLVRDPSNISFRSGYLWKYIERNMVVMARIGGMDIPSIPLTDSSIASTLFVHAGFNTRFLTTLMPNNVESKDKNNKWWSPVSYNEELFKYMQDPDLDERTAKLKLYNFFLLRDSPLETRAFDIDDGKPVNCDLIRMLLDMFAVERIIVGHNPQFKTRKMEVLCGGQIILSDNLITSYYIPGSLGAPSVMVMSFEAGRLTGIDAKYITPEKMRLYQPPQEMSRSMMGRLSRSGTVHSNLSSSMDHHSVVPHQSANLLFLNNEVHITKGDLNGVSGLVVTILRSDSAVIPLIRKLIEKNSEGIPPITETPASQGRPQYFLRTASTSLVPKGGVFTPSGLSRISLIEANLRAKFGVCISPERRNTPKLVYGKNSENDDQIELINLSALVPCPPEQPANL